MAEHAKLSTSYVSLIEAGHRIPSMTAVTKLARSLRVLHAPGHGPEVASSRRGEDLRPARPVAPCPSGGGRVGKAGRGALNWSQSPRAFAATLGFPLKRLRALAARPDPFYGEPRYEDRGRGRTPRRIDQARNPLKRIQRAIHDLMMETADFPPYVYGGIKGRSAKQFANRHRNKSCLIRLDITDFFPSITAAVQQGSGANCCRASDSCETWWNVSATGLLCKYDRRQPRTCARGSPD